MGHHRSGNKVRFVGPARHDATLVDTAGVLGGSVRPDSGGDVSPRLEGVVPGDVEVDAGGDGDLAAGAAWEEGVTRETMTRGSAVEIGFDAGGVVTPHSAARFGGRSELGPEVGRRASEALAAARSRLEHARRPESDTAAANVDRRLRGLRERTDAGCTLRNKVDDLTDHQHQRQAVVNEQNPARGPLLAEQALLTQALDETLVNRVLDELEAEAGTVPCGSDR